MIAVLTAVISVVAGCSSNETTQSATRTATVTNTVTEATTATKTTTVTKTAPARSGGRWVGNGVNGADARGFTSGPARCNTSDSAILIVRTTAPGKAGSKVVICENDRGRYYRGARDKAGDAGISLGNVSVENGYYVARNGTTSYAVDANVLRIVQNNFPSTETVIESAVWEN